MSAFILFYSLFSLEALNVYVNVSINFMYISVIQFMCVCLCTFLYLENFCLVLFIYWLHPV